MNRSALPGEGRDVPAERTGCSGVTAWRRLRDWTEAGVWPQLHEVLLVERSLSSGPGQEYRILRGVVMMVALSGLSERNEFSAVIIRTDFTDEAAWREVTAELERSSHYDGDPADSYDVVDAPERTQTRSWRRYRLTRSCGTSSVWCSSPTARRCVLTTTPCLRSPP
jgi:hypothetical protein